jgi:hypothetical protein
MKGPILGCCGVKTTEHGEVRSKVNRTARSITPHTAPNSKSIIAGLFALTSAAARAVASTPAACKSKKKTKETGKPVLKAAARPEERATWNKTPKIVPGTKASLLGCSRSPQGRSGRWRQRQPPVREKKRYTTGKPVLKAAARPEERARWNKTPKLSQGQKHRCLVVRAHLRGGPGGGAAAFAEGGSCIFEAEHSPKAY